jgi:hypothetical protein
VTAPHDLAEQEPAANGEVPRTLEEVRFRSILDRDAHDQREAVRQGYSSVNELAIDELGRAFHQLKDELRTLQERCERDFQHLQEILEQAGLGL